MRIEILRECDSSTTEKVHEAFDRLLPQLSSSAQPLSLEEIQKLLAQECLHLVCAVDEDALAGCFRYSNWPPSMDRRCRYRSGRTRSRRGTGPC